MCAPGRVSICGKTCLESTALVDTGVSQSPGVLTTHYKPYYSIGTSESSQICALAGISAVLSRMLFHCYFIEIGLCPAPPSSTL